MARTGLYYASLRLPGPPSDLPGRVAVELLEHAAEELVIGETVLIQDLQHRLVGGADVVVDVAEAHVVHVLCEGDADILAEHAAEVVAVEAEDRRDLLERERLHIVLVNVGHDLLDPELVAARFGEIFFV